MGWPNWRRKGEGGKEKGNRIPPSPSSLPTPNRNRKGGRPNREVPSRIPPTWGAPLAASPPLQPIYTKGAPLEHTTNIVSRVRRPPPHFTPPVIFTYCLGEALHGSLHHHRHHAVVLMKLSLETLLDQEFEGSHRAKGVYNSEVS